MTPTPSRFWRVHSSRDRYLRWGRDEMGWAVYLFLNAENGDAAQGIRVRMVDDLLARHKLVGMARAQVEELLGVPPATPYFREYDYVY